MDRIKGKHKGVYYREHPTRKNGVRKDRYFYLRYTVNGRQREEGFGWESEGFTETKAAAEIETIREHIKKGEGYTSLAEKYQNTSFEERKKSQNMTFDEFFCNIYNPVYIKKNDGKANSYQKWAKPFIGDKRLGDITPADIEKIKRSVLDAGRQPATAERVLAHLSHMFNMARQENIYDGKNPLTTVKRPKYDNRRIRFFTKEESDILLKELKKISCQKKDFGAEYYKKNKISQLYEMVLASVYCGFRAGEIRQLKVYDIDFGTNFISIKDPKNSKNRRVPMPDVVRNMFARRIGELHLKPQDYIFRQKNGEPLTEISDQYYRIVDRLFNQNIDDPREKVVFHTCRHTYASWLVMAGVDLYTVKELMGHDTIEMTMRYAHLAPNKFKAAIAALNL